MTEVPIDGNVAARLRLVAADMPDATAIAEPSGPPRPGASRHYSLTTFGQLDRDSDAIARGLLDWGVRPGMRLAMLVPFGASFIELVFALMKAGAVVVLVDPGMGKQHLVRCLSEANPDGFVGIPKAQAIRCLLRGKFRNAKWNVTLGRRWLWGGKTIAGLKTQGMALLERELLERELLERELLERELLDGVSATAFPAIDQSSAAAIIFTTGSTGPPKGVLYTHGTFHAQIDRIQHRYRIQPGSRDLACFPLFGLFDAVMGVTTVIPDMDPTRPADVDPRRLIEAVEQWDIDQAFGSPALWNSVVRWCEKERVERPFPTLKRVLSAGAPVPAVTLEKLRRLIDPDAIIVTPYGATEALPIASIESREIITETGPASSQGMGTCVGTRFEGVQWRVIEIDDGPIRDLADTRELPTGQVGELMVAGPMVTTQYAVRRDQNAIHKVADGDRTWHRMGDVGYLDDRDRFWFCGRKTHRVVATNRTFYTVPCEAIFNNHPAIDRSALVPRGHKPDQTPVMIVRPHQQQFPTSDADRKQLHREMTELAAGNPLTSPIDEIIIREAPLPVDIRHNSKIFREQLAAEIELTSPRD